ncbi:MAG: S9 family peptidase, partial [Anaerolineaceae bacterium]|nr:S9 family peptidase [Anaerolineaceae bacterium]
APFGDKYLLSFSSDGKWLAYFGFEGEDLHYKNQGLWIVPVDGSKPARNITANYDFHVSAWTINDMGEPEFIPPTWSRDSQTIYFQVAEHGRTLLKSIRIDGSAIMDVINEPGVVGSFSWNADQTKMAYIFGNLYDPCQVYLYEANTNTKRCLTDVNSSLLKNIQLGEVEEVWFKGPDENDLQGWVIKPPDFDPSKQYPAIIEIHGGPMTQYGFFFMHEFNYFTSRGFVVCFCNPRGGRGYGEEHTKAIWKDWGSKDYQDIMAWTDKVETLPFVDKSKIGVTGGSYGGYMTVWLIGHTQRYKAAVTQRCVSNLISMWGSSDFNWAFQVELANGAPFEDLNKYWDQSPIKYIGNAATPTLVIHNENDMRCPIEQGEQVFVALKKLGVETAFVRFPDEFHGMSRTGRTDRKIARLNHIIGWFEKHLK